MYQVYHSNIDRIEKYDTLHKVAQEMMNSPKDSVTLLGVEEVDSLRAFNVDEIEEIQKISNRLKFEKAMGL